MAQPGDIYKASEKIGPTGTEQTWGASPYPNSPGGGNFGNTGGLYSVAGKGYGTAPDALMSDPRFAAMMGLGSEAAWRDFQMQRPSTGTAERLRGQAYSGIMGDILNQQANQGLRDREAQWRDQQKWNWMQSMWPQFQAYMSGQSTGGGLPAGVDINQLVAQALAPVTRRQDEAATQAKNDWTSMGRNVGENATWQNLSQQRDSRNQEAVGATSADVVLRALGPILQAQQQRQVQAQAQWAPFVNFLFGGR